MKARLIIISETREYKALQESVLGKYRLLS